jgi:hypothetical protein
MPKADESLLANDALAVPVAVPVDQARSSMGVANLYPSPVDASVEGVAAVQASAVVEGKMMRQVNTTRPCRDVGWAIIFLAALAASFLAGSMAVSRAKDAGDALKACPFFKDTQQYKATLTPSPGDDAPAVPVEDALGPIVGGLTVVVGISLLVAVVYLWSLETHSRCITWTSVCLWPVATFMSGVYLLIHSVEVEEQDKANCAFGNCQFSAYMTMGFSLLLALVIWVRRHNVELTAELLRMSATAFKQNLSLIWTTGLVAIGLSSFLISPLGVMSIVAMDPEDVSLVYAGCPGCDFNGNATTDPAIITFEDLEAKCTDFKHSDITPNAGIAVAVSFMVIWVGMLSKEMKIANVGGCIGLHYFEQEVTGARAVHSLKWSLTSNFGSLCYCSLILTLIEVVDQLLEKLRDTARRGDNIALKIVVEIVACCWRSIQAWAEFLTKMAVIGFAITGDPFCKSAKDITTMLMRHNLDGVFVDSFASFTTTCLALAVSMVMGVVGYVAGGAASNFQAWASAFLTFLISFVVLVAVAGIVLVTCNTHYICYVLDLDHQYAPSTNTQEIHALYARAIEDRIGVMKKDKSWDTKGPGKRGNANAIAAGQAPGPTALGAAAHRRVV